MTIRGKIVSLPIAILLLFGLVVGLSSLLQRQVAEEVLSITAYHEPLEALVADINVISSDYELVALRLLRASDVDAEAVKAEQARAQEIAGRLTGDFRQAGALLDQAIDDARLTLKDRLALARLQGLFRLLERQVQPFIAVGTNVVQAYGEGHKDDTNRLSLEFRDYEEAFGPDIASIRHSLVALGDAATKRVHRQQQEIEYLGFGLFGFAALLGLGAGVAVATRVVGALRRVLEGTRAVETGELTVLVPITTRDEVGQLAAAFNRMVGELRAKERIKDTFGKYIDPRIVAGLIEGNTESGDHAERRQVSVFFSDIKGFTSISEQLTAGAMVNLLNHYFTAVTEAIRAQGGIVDKYIGDAVMAFWAPPFSPGDGHAAAACLAALAQRTAIAELRTKLPEIVGLRRNAPDLVVRMGIATGEVVVGTIGSPTAKSFTVIGDTVNLASRLEGVNKVYGTLSIIAEDTYRLAQNEIEAREIDVIAVAGKSEPIRIYELICRSGDISAGQAELREAFAKGLEAYRRRDWVAAQQLFTACRELAPEDGPTRVFLQRLTALRDAPLPQDWDGVWRLTEK